MEQGGFKVKIERSYEISLDDIDKRMLEIQDFVDVSIEDVAKSIALERFSDECEIYDIKYFVSAKIEKIV